MAGKFVSKLNLNLNNAPGWKTNRKIVVFESDDWGSIRMPTKEVYQDLLSKGYRVDLNPYERYDSLASETDLKMLFDTLTKVKDSNGNHPVITANAIMCNPDFNKIKESGYTEYHYEHFTATLANYPEHRNSFELWKQGMQAGVFFPQYHGREHLNVSKFMAALQQNDADAHMAFQNRMPGTIAHGLPAKGNFYVEATRFNSEKDKWDKLDIFLEGYKIFEDTFGYKSKTVIPTNYTWSPEYDKQASEAGIETYQCSSKMKEPVIGDTRKNIYHKIYIGKKNKYGQNYLTRNVIFEPSLYGEAKSSVKGCIDQISNAFFWNRPAVIATHRINFIGFLDEGNRNKNLDSFSTLIKEIMKRWPSAEFLTSSQLSDLIRQKK